MVKSAAIVLTLTVLVRVLSTEPGRAALASGRDEFKVKRAEVFAFTQEPQVTRRGDRVTITFGSKAACDATVAIERAGAEIVRHLASGVLGPNAPAPFLPFHETWLL